MTHKDLGDWIRLFLYGGVPMSNIMICVGRGKLIRWHATGEIETIPNAEEINGRSENNSQGTLPTPKP